MADIVNTIETGFDARKDKPQATARLTRALETYFKACGGCKYCYGRGYLDPVNSFKVKLCKCERGEKLNQLLELKSFSKLSE